MNKAGYYGPLDARIAVAWNWISVPPPSAYTDTLRLRFDGLARRFQLPPPCFACPPGPSVEMVYVRLAR